MRIQCAVLIAVVTFVVCCLGCSENNETCWVKCPQSVLDDIGAVGVSVGCQDVIRLQMESPSSCAPNVVHHDETWVAGVRCEIGCDDATPFPGLP